LINLKKKKTGLSDKSLEGIDIGVLKTVKLKKALKKIH